MCTHIIFAVPANNKNGENGDKDSDSKGSRYGEWYQSNDNKIATIILICYMMLICKL